MIFSKNKILAIILVLSNYCFGQIPLLNSSPLITNKVIYLDFDGQNVVGTGWNSGNLITALPSNMSSTNIITIWKRVSEDYIPFDVNITTDSMRFNNAPPNKRMRVIITPTSAWYGTGAGGVAFVNSFAWGGTPGTPCWIFENLLGNSVKNVAEAIAHEAGHTLTLRHHSIYNASCVKTAEYNPGTGTGMTSWAPIMGVGYTRNVTIWHFGKNATSCTTIQYDHSTNNPGITGPGYLSFIPDDIGNTLPNSKILNLTTLNVVDSGIISQPTDVDAFQFTICNNRDVSISVKPWALDTVNYQGADLDVRLHLYDASNNLLALDTTLSRLNTRIGLNLNPGTYYFVVDGGRSANYSDYGSLGRYYVNVKATNPPVLANSIVTSTNICAGQNTTLNYASNGTPTSFTWTIDGPTSSILNTANPNIAFSPAGIYTVSLLANNISSASCLSTVTLNIGASPNLTVTGTNSICPGKTVTLTASGATSYTWLPGAFGGTAQILSPLANTTYTVFGQNGMCINSSVTTVTVSPNFTLSAVASTTLLCTGGTVTITASGATNYTFTPGNITSNPAVFSPIYSTPYSIIGSYLGCKKTIGRTVNIVPRFMVNVNSSDSVICTGGSVTLSSTGANSFTYNPGNLTGFQTVVNPLATTEYTVVGTGAGQCKEDTTITIKVKECNFVGIKKEDLSGNFKIYPNPASDNITIETFEGNTQIEIINSIGEIIYSKDLNGKILHINTERWAAGIYFVKLSTGNKNLYTEKLILK